MTVTDVRRTPPRDLDDPRRRPRRPDGLTGRRNEPRRPGSAAGSTPATEAPATEAWWNDLSAEARETACRVARCGGYLPADLAHQLVRAGVPILMPDDVRRHVQHQTTA